MFFSENNRLSKPHFDWPLLVTSYLLALYGVLAITIANFNPSLGPDAGKHRDPGYRAKYDRPR